jgi:gluconokinase
MDAAHRGIYVVMGVSGSGKTLIGEALARELGAEFVEGDAYHPAENIARMSAGIPLTDDDRAQWLRALATRIEDARSDGTGLVVTSSALKRAYRDILRGKADDVQFVFLKGERELISERLANRRGHFMPPSLLESQLTTLEEPTRDEHAWVCDIRQSPADLVAALVVRASK